MTYKYAKSPGVLRWVGPADGCLVQEVMSVVQHIDVGENVFRTLIEILKNNELARMGGTGGNEGKLRRG